VNTTTSRVAGRAGVSWGAQVHHFPTKDDLVAEALAHLGRRRSEHGRRASPPCRRTASGSPACSTTCGTRTAGPLFDASLELWVAARNNPAPRTRMIEFERSIALSAWTIAAEELGPIVNRPEFRHAVDVAVATMRGYALLRGSRGEDADAGRTPVDRRPPAAAGPVRRRVAIATRPP
jgi:hypothetical protein